MNEEYDCIICKEKLSSLMDVYLEKEILICNNNHKFHKDCILSNQFKLECAICRIDITNLLNEEEIKIINENYKKYKNYIEEEDRNDIINNLANLNNEIIIFDESYGRSFLRNFIRLVDEMNDDIEIQINQQNNNTIIGSHRFQNNTSSEGTSPLEINEDYNSELNPGFTTTINPLHTELNSLDEINFNYNELGVDGNEEYLHSLSSSSSSEDEYSTE